MNYLLHKINPQLNQARYYRVEVRPCIGSAYAVHRIWGRIGRRRSGSLITPVAGEVEALAVAEKLVAAKLKRGYIVISEGEKP